MSTCNGSAWVVTKYTDGTEVHAHPNHETEDVALAEELGYDSVQPMTFDHDQLHTELVFILVGDSSPALWAVAHGESTNTDLIRAEEAMVLAVQKFINLYEKEQL